MPPARCTANVAQLPGTIITPVLNAPIPSNTNVLWCASLQLAWNESGITSTDPLLAPLSQPVVTKSDISPRDLIVCSGPNTSSLRHRIRHELTSRFGENAPTPLLDQWGPVPGIGFYTYMRLAMPFEYAFEQLTPVANPKSDDDTPSDAPHPPFAYAAFGLESYKPDNPGMQKMGQQVRIIWHQYSREPERQEHFVVELRTKSPNFRLFLAKLPSQTTLYHAVEAVLARVTHPNEGTIAGLYAQMQVLNQAAEAQHDAESSHDLMEKIISAYDHLSVLMDRDGLEIPVLDFDLTKRFDELTGRRTNAGPVAYLAQRIRFKLDHTGANLESESAGSIFAMEPRMFVFRPPFLILIVSAKSARPILACWIGNSELLTPAPPSVKN